MLRQRVVTSLILAAGGLAALFLLPAPAFSAVAAGVFAGLGGWEAARLAGVESRPGRLAYAAILVAICLALYLRLPGTWLALTMSAACVVWLGCLGWLSRPALGREPTSARIVLKLLVLTVILCTAWLALSWLQAGSPWWVVMLLVLIAAADTCAYFTGRHFGGPRLAPAISPGKTRSGAAGGLAGAMALTALAAAVMPDSPFTPLAAGLLGLAVGLISIGGDLFISLLKRQRGLKDTSALLPGHGGVLDRFDSLSAALPFFALAIMLWGH